MRRIRAGAAYVMALAILGVAVGCNGRPARDPAKAERSASYYMQLSSSLMKAGRVGEALETAQQAIDREPDNAGIRQSLGVMCLGAGLYERAETEFLEALKLDPYLTEARTYLGAVYQELGRFDDAEREYRAALDSPAYPNPEKAYLGLGVLLAKQGREDEAEVNLRRAVGVNPRYHMAHYHLASLLERVGQLSEAAHEYEVAEPAFRNSGEYWYRRGFTYYRIGDERQARDSLHRVRDVAPGSESAQQAGELLELLGG